MFVEETGLVSSLPPAPAPSFGSDACTVFPMISSPRGRELAGVGCLLGAGAFTASSQLFSKERTMLPVLGLRSVGAER